MAVSVPAFRARPGSTGHRLASAVLVVAAVAAASVTAFYSRKAGLVMAAGVPFTLLTSLRTKFAAFWVVLLLGGWAQVHYPGSGLKSIPAGIVLVMVAHVLWDLVTNRERLPIRHPYVLVVLLLALVTVLEARNPVTVAAGQSYSGLRTYLLPMGLFLVGLVMMRDRDNFRLFLRVAVLAYLIAGAYALKQVVGGFDHAETAYWTAQPGTFVIVEKKIFSTVGSPDAFGFVSAVSVLISLACRPLRVFPRVSVLTGAMGLVGVVVSGVRIATVALVVAGFLFVLLQFDNPQTRSRAAGVLLIGSALGLVLATAIVLSPTGTRQQVGVERTPFSAAIQRFALLKGGTSDPDLHGRMTHVGQFITYLDHHPWGTGGGTSGIVIEQSLANNQQPKLPAYALNTPFLFNHDFLLFDYGFELGAIGLGLFVFIILSGVIRSVRSSRRSVEDMAAATFYALAGAVALLALVHNLTNESFRDLPVSAYVWFLLGGLVTMRPRSPALGPSTPAREAPAA